MSKPSEAATRTSQEVYATEVLKVSRELALEYDYTCTHIAVEGTALSKTHSLMPERTEGADAA
ncbi:hypothetical protein EYF80_048201 [Liparis tanakae]|uniref:Uncharacterized protein n=1 Tax=Liparis tanakae TaxID=230148 RepID=A0A4Z2FK59_9TELE|nr:hypothetical protein EYF80_048201 [Liparis tanakae]